jgi:hypothetical protein
MGTKHHCIVVMPVQTGIQNLDTYSKKEKRKFLILSNWIPAFAGMTHGDETSLYCRHAGDGW